MVKNFEPPAQGQVCILDHLHQGDIGKRLPPNRLQTIFMITVGYAKSAPPTVTICRPSGFNAVIPMGLGLVGGFEFKLSLSMQYGVIVNRLALSVS
ncbi:MAG: hypothetical protein ABIZ95_22275 [Pyrinomonadaceae bacterium]